MSYPSYPSYPYGGGFAPPAPKKDPADERIDEQAKHDGKRSREPSERFIRASAIITVETSRRSEFPNLVRGPKEDAEQFAERVKQALIKLQGGL